MVTSSLAYVTASMETLVNDVIFRGVHVAFLENVGSNGLPGAQIEATHNVKQQISNRSPSTPVRTRPILGRMCWNPNVPVIPNTAPIPVSKPNIDSLIP